MPDIQRADPHSRRTAVIFVAAAALVGLALIVVTRSQLGAFQKFLADSPAELHANLGIITRALIAAVVLPVWAANIYLWRLGSRIVASGVFPPPGMPVIRDTIVLRDAAARKCGRVLQILAAVMCAAAVGFAVALWRLAVLIRLPKEILRHFSWLKSSEARARNVARALHVLSGKPGRFMARSWARSR